MGARRLTPFVSGLVDTRRSLKPNSKRQNLLFADHSCIDFINGRRTGGAEHNGNQDGAVCSAVASIRGAIDWNDSRVSGPAAILDGGGSRPKTVAVQRLLQRISASRIAKGTDPDRDIGIQRCRFQIVSMAETLSRVISNANGGMNSNSPMTG